MTYFKKIMALLCVYAMIVTAVPKTEAQMPGLNVNARYGLSSWAINNQRVASQFNYDIDSIYGSGLGTFSFPATTIQNALSFGGNKKLNPFLANWNGSLPNVKIVDIVSANTETVNQNSAPNCAGTGGNISAAVCTLSLAAANAHASYHLRSGTCGLREALNDLGTAGGTVIVDQKFYDDGCTASTITGITVAQGQLANQYVLDISNGQYQWYQLRGNSLSTTSAPTALTTAGGAAATLTTSTTGGSITNGAAIRAGITCMDAIGRETALSTDSAGTAVVTTGAGSTNSITVVAPGTAGCPNSVGYRLYLSAAGGGSLSEILYVPSAAGCTAATIATGLPAACALNSNSVVQALVTNTAGVPLSGVVSLGLATNTAFTPVSSPTLPGTQLVYGPFPAITTVTTVQTAAEVPLPAGFFNVLERAYLVCLAGVGTPAAATVAGTFKLTLGPRQATNVQTIDQVNWTASSTWNPAAASNWTYCAIASTAATGTSGTIEMNTATGFSTSATAAAVPPAFGPQLDQTTAASSALDLTQQQYLDVLVTASASSFTTFTVRKISIIPIS